MFKNIYSLLRVCSLCGSVTGQSVNYCFGCRTTMEQAALYKGWGTDGPAIHHYLFETNSHKKNHHYRQLIRIKEGPAPLLTAWLCRLLIKKRILLKPDIHGELVFVPAPSSTERDHAHRLAAECARQMKATMHDVLVKGSSTSQKKLPLAERFLADIHLASDIEVRGRNVIVVDDLITTGGTAFDCLKALEGIAKSVEVWAPYRTVLLHPHDPFAITHQDEKTDDCNTFNDIDG